jgi:hypothetical protein
MKKHDGARTRKSNSRKRKLERDAQAKKLRDE